MSATRELTTVAVTLSVFAMFTWLSPRPEIYRAPPASDTRCIINPLALNTGVNYLCEKERLP